jgi:hypothetical protein
MKLFLSNRPIVTTQLQTKLDFANPILVVVQQVIDGSAMIVALKNSGAGGAEIVTA